MGEERFEVSPLDELDDPEMGSGVWGEGIGGWNGFLGGEDGAEDPFPQPGYQGFLSLSVGEAVPIYWTGRRPDSLGVIEVVLVSSTGKQLTKVSGPWKVTWFTTSPPLVQLAVNCPPLTLKPWAL